jgi:hypothetical protein
MIIDKNKILMAPVRFVDSLLDRICAALGAIAFAQFPQYLVLYIQRLGGHVDEAARNIDKYREIAKEVGKSLYQYSQHLLGSNDPAVFKTGQKVAQDLQRYDSLAAALKELQSAPAYKKFFVFLKDMDFDIARATLANFTPGLPFNLEGAAYAAAGIIIGMVLYFCVSRLVVLAVKKIAARKQNPAPYPPYPAG